MTRQLYSAEMLQAATNGEMGRLRDENAKMKVELKRLYLLEIAVRANLDLIPEPAAGRIRRALGE